MKRMVLVLSVALMMVAMMLVMAAPAFAVGGRGSHHILVGQNSGSDVGGEGGSIYPGSGSGGGCGTGPFGNGGGGGNYCG